jgi:hypothetical protein
VTKNSKYVNGIELINQVHSWESTVLFYLH